MYERNIEATSILFIYRGRRWEEFSTEEKGNLYIVSVQLGFREIILNLLRCVQNFSLNSRNFSQIFLEVNRL